MKRLVVCAWALTITACAGDVPAERDDAGLLGADAQASVPRPSCNPNGVAADCDPVAQTGCPEGTACYVLRNLGPSCACPGVLTEGDACDTTAECAPGNVCAGTAPPGVCRRTCDPGAAAPGCPEGTFCLFISAFPDNGYCELD